MLVVFVLIEAFYEGWAQSDDDKKQAIWDGLCREMDRRQEEEARTEAYLLAKFEEEVQSRIDTTVLVTARRLFGG